jgi:hypothetical protein
MNISELAKILLLAKDKYGDIAVGAYPAEYCYELSKPEDMMNIAPRIMTDHSNASATNLPGIDPVAGQQECAGDNFLVLFHLDD